MEFLEYEKLKCKIYEFVEANGDIVNKDGLYTRFLESLGCEHINSDRYQITFYYNGEQFRINKHFKTFGR